MRRSIFSFSKSLFWFQQKRYAHHLHGTVSPSGWEIPYNFGSRAPLHLVLVRHGESEGNLVKKMVKEGDDSLWVDLLEHRHTANYRLTDKGRKQAALSGQWVRNNISKYLTSEYIRAQETAGHLGLENALWKVDYLLREREKGVLVGTVEREEKEGGGREGEREGEREERERYVRFANRFRKEEPFYWSPPAGESLGQVCLRVDQVLRAICTHSDDLEKKEGLKVIIVCHGNVMKAFRMRLEGMTQAQFKNWEREAEGEERGEERGGERAGERGRERGERAEIEKQENPKLKIYNGHVFHYSRVDPQTKREGERLRFVRSVCPSVLESFCDWREIKYPLFSNESLIDHANDIPQIANK